MTRERRTISAVFMAVLLVLASGTAVSLAVTGSSTTDAGTNAVGVQETTTAAEDGNETASVTFEEQETDGEQVVVESVTMPEGGFIAIHDASVAEAPLSSVLGNSVYLEAGTHENVTITLARPITESQTLVAMPHLDTNDNQVYDFVLSTGELDGPYTADGSIVIDQANVTLAEETTTTTEAPEETTTTTTEEVVETTTTEEPVETTTTTEEVVETTTTEEPVETTTTTEEVVETTTTEEPAETTTTTEEVVETTTTEEPVETTTTTEEPVETTTTTEEPVETTTTTEEIVETTTTEEPVETTTTTEEVVETTTTEEPVETTTEEVEEPPAEMEQFIFKIEQMSIDEWSFVVGDEETPDRTETISNVNIQDRRVTINLTEVLQQGDVSQEEMGQITTQSPEQVEEQLEENLSQDIPTVRFVIQNVNVENVTFVITAPEDVELPQPPMMTTTEEPEETTTTEEVVEETTTTEEVVEETTTTEEVVEETTTTEEEVEETTTTEEIVEETTTTEEVVEETTTEEVVEETTTTEEVVEETTTTEEEVEETTTTEEVVEETTTEEEVEETTTTEETMTAAELSSFEVSELDAPESATTGDTINVSASVRNPNDQEATQTVAFRLEGTVIARESVTLDAGEQTTVSFEIDTEGVPAGQYIHGVYTRDFGELAVIVLEESTTETTTAAETTVADNETTTAEA